MQNPQQQIFQNLSKNTPHHTLSQHITQKHQIFPKYRKEQIENQFDIVDLYKSGKLTQKQIILYLSDKYQWVNIDILKQVFNTMNWDQQNTVTKQQFVNKYLQRQHKLYHQINNLKYYQNWVDTLDQILRHQTSNHSIQPRMYFYIQIRSIQLYWKSKMITWMDILAQYQNHQTKTSYQIEQIMHEANYPSFQLWLPVKEDYFFIKFQFYSTTNRQLMYGQTYIKIPVFDRIDKMKSLQLDITKNGKSVGHSLVYLYAEPSVENVREQIKELKSKQRSYSDAIPSKVKQYEYLQFLWGTRQKSPNKVQPVDVSWMLGARIILLTLLGIFGLIVHIFGRFQPLSLITMFLMLRTWQYVFQRSQKFLITWLTVLSIVLDIVWIALCSSDLNQINFISSQVTTIITYILLGIKVVLLAYLVVVEKALSSK